LQAILKLKHFAPDLSQLAPNVFSIGEIKLSSRPMLGLIFSSIDNPLIAASLVIGLGAVALVAGKQFQMSRERRRGHRERERQRREFWG
jgi:hypothetical protein